MLSRSNMAGSSGQWKEASQFCAHTCPESVDQHGSKYAHLRGCPSRFPVNGTRAGVGRKNCADVGREKVRTILFDDSQRGICEAGEQKGG